MISQEARSDMDVIGKLDRLRLERNLSVYRLAELSGINHSTLANTFSHRTVPSIKNLELMCKTFGISLSQFFAENESSPMRLSPNEITLIRNYRKLPEQLKTAVSDIVNLVPDLKN